ncbi:MAG: SRPBCC family protein [Polyangiales bacterium]
MTQATLPLPKRILVSGLSLVALAGPSGAVASGGPFANPVVTRQVSDSASNIAWGEAEAELGRALDEILPVVADYARYETFMPNFQRSRVLAQRGSRAWVYMEVSAAAGALRLWGQLDMKERTEETDGARVIEATLLEGNIEAFRAEWRLEPSADGERTRVAFRIFVDPDLPLPASLISRENEPAAGRSIEALRTRLEGKLP